VSDVQQLERALDKSKSKQQQNFKDSEIPGTIKYHTKYTHR